MKRVYKRREKGSIPIAVISITALLLLAGIGYLYWQNFLNKSAVEQLSTTQTNNSPSKPDPYESWKSYASKRYGYTIKFPSTWIVVNETDTDGPYIRNLDLASSPNTPRDSGTGYPEGFQYIRVLVEDDTVAGKPVAEWYSALGTSKISDGPVTYTPESVEQVTINKLAAKKTKSVFTETDEVIYILQNEKLYSIWLYPYGVSSDKTIKQILNSFTP